MGARACNHIIDLVWLNRWPNPLGTKEVFYLFNIHMISTYLRIVKMKKLQPEGSSSNPGNYMRNIWRPPLGTAQSTVVLSLLSFFPVH